MRYHHDPDSDPSVLAPGQVALSRVLFAANQYVNSMDVSILKGGPMDRDPTVVESLGLPADSLPKILVEFQLSSRPCLRFSARDLLRSNYCLFVGHWLDDPAL